MGRGRCPDGPPGLKPAPPGRGAWLFRHRNLMGIAVAAFLILWPWGRSPLTVWPLALGLGFIHGGVALRLWSVLQIHGSARKTSRFKAPRLISWGPYAMVRNPLYVANLTVFSGFAFLAGLPWVLPLLLAALWIWYDLIARQEERFLEAAFPGEYAEYQRSTGRWIPRPRWRGAPPEVPPYPFARLLRRERGHLITVSVGAALAVALRLWLSR